MPRVLIQHDVCTVHHLSNSVPPLSRVRFSPSLMYIATTSLVSVASWLGKYHKPTLPTVRQCGPHIPHNHRPQNSGHSTPTTSDGPCMAQLPVFEPVRASRQISVAPLNMHLSEMTRYCIPSPPTRRCEYSSPSSMRPSISSCTLRLTPFHLSHSPWPRGRRTPASSASIVRS